MNRIYIPAQNAEWWKKLLVEEKQWKEGCSAKGFPRPASLHHGGRESGGSI